MCDRNFITKLGQDHQALIELANEPNVKLNFRGATLELSTEQISKELKAVWENVRDITSKTSLGNNKSQNETDDALKTCYRGEYETWQLINELVSSEKLYFEMKGSTANLSKSLCPSTLEHEVLFSDHASAVVHAVARWLEKVHDEDATLKFKECKINAIANRADLDDMNPASPEAEQLELTTLMALFEKLKSGKIIEA